MISFLFWNLNQQPLQERVARLVQTHGIDVVMLAECAIPATAMLETLNQETGATFCQPFSESRKIAILTRFPPSALVAIFDDAPGRLAVRRLIVGSGPDVLLAVVHFYDRRNWPPDDQMLECTNLARDIVRVEDDYGHRRTILVGDLNMNPFDPGLVAANGLHAVMTQEVAGRGTRKVGEQSYPFFYNPMWGHFGDRTHGPPGTHYYVGKQVAYFWHMFDQVLLRPDLMDLLDEVKILDTDGRDSLVNRRGFPDKKGASDHLPLLFRLKL